MQFFAKHHACQPRRHELHARFAFFFSLRLHHAQAPPAVLNSDLEETASPNIITFTYKLDVVLYRPFKNL